MNMRPTLRFAPRLAVAVTLVIGSLAGSAAAAGTLPPSGTISATIPVDDGGGQIAVGFDSVWVANYGHDTVSRIDPSTDQVTAVIPVGSAPFGLAIGDGAVWAANEDGNTVSRIDPSTNAVTATIPVGINPIGVAVTPGAVWVANHNGIPSGSVMRIDPSSNAVVDTIPVGMQEFCCGPAHMAAGAGAVWVGVPNLDAVVRIDPGSDSVDATIHVGRGVCGDLAASDSAVWVAGGGRGCAPGISRIDPNTDQLAQSKLGAGGYTAGLALGFGSLWFTTLTTDFIGRLDPSSGDVTGLLKASGSPESVASGFGSMWVADPALSSALRVEPAS